MRRPLALLLGLLGASPQEAAPIRVLVVTGHDYAHDWKKTTPALREVLEADRRIKVDVLEGPDKLESADLKPYQVVLLHFSSGPLNQKDFKDPGEKARENLQGHVRGGGGLFVLHFACFAFRDWPEFRNLAGRVWDRVRGHDPRGPFEVRLVKPDHPICRGMDATFQADDELYTCLEGEREIEVLTVARSKVTKQEHPMAFVFRYGEGRVFHTPLGHDARAIRMPGVAELFRRGCAWAAGRDPVPGP